MIPRALIQMAYNIQLVRHFQPVLNESGSNRWNQHLLCKRQAGLIVFTFVLSFVLSNKNFAQTQGNLTTKMVLSDSTEIVLNVSSDEAGNHQFKMSNTDGASAEFSMSFLLMEQFVSQVSSKLTSVFAIADSVVKADRTTSAFRTAFIEVVAWAATIEDSDGPVAGKLRIMQYVPLHSAAMFRTDTVETTGSSAPTVGFAMAKGSDLSFLKQAMASKGESFRTVDSEMTADNLKTLRKRLNTKRIYAVSAIGTDSVRVLYRPHRTQETELLRDSVKVQDVQVEFRSGYLERIIVTAIVDGKETRFYNAMPIPFSTTRDIMQLRRYHLRNLDHTEQTSVFNFSMNLSDLISYLPTVRSGRRDFSPADSDLTLSPQARSTDPAYVLRKKSTQELFTAKAFTDFFGLDPNSPNGLVQIEVERDININNHRYAFTHRNPGLANFGFLQNLRVTATLSKIEGNNRALPISSTDSIVDGELQRTRYVSPIGLVSHETFSIGLMQNLLHIDLPEFKSAIDLDFRYRAGLTILEDSVRAIDNGQIVTSERAPERTTVSANHFAPVLRITTQLEERYGLEVSYTLNAIFMEYGHFSLVRSADRYERTGSMNGSPFVGMLSIQLWFRPYGRMKKVGGEIPETGKLFFRFNLHHNYAQNSEKFFQAQLGYAFNIFKSNK